MRLQNGFTLIELIVTLMVLSILAVTALPSLANWYQASRGVGTIKQLESMLRLARSHAISYGVRVTVCPLIDNKCHNNWQAELTVFTDTGSTNTLDGTDEILAHYPEADANDTRRYSRTSLRFLTDGLASGFNGTLTFCPGSPESPYARALKISNAGRIRQASGTVSCSS